MATYQKRKTKKGISITATVRIYPYPSQSKTFRRLTDARAWAEDLESDIRHCRFKPVFQKNKHLLSELIDKYISDTFHLRKSPQFPKTTLMWWHERLGKYRLCDINRSLIKSTWKQLETNPSKRTGRLLSNRTLNAYLETFSACLSYGSYELEWLENNPCRGIRRKSVKGNWRLRILTEDELTRLIQAVKKSSNNYLLPSVLISLSTGGRRTEVMSLKWDDIDLEKRIVTYNETKNGYSRTVALSKSAIESLKKLYLSDNNIRVFPRRKPLWKMGKGKSSKPWEEMTNPFARALEEAKIKDFRWHDLRHQAASLLLGSGASLEEVGKLLGHRSPEMTWRYGKLLQERNQTLVSEVDRRYIEKKLTA